MKQVIIMITMSMLMLVGCGGGGSSDIPNTMIPDNTNNDKFTLNLGNLHVDSESSISSRMTMKLYEGLTEVETVSMSKEGVITLEGSDANHFELVGGKVRFKRAAEVGSYDVDIKAVKGTKTVVIKRRYEIVQGLKSLMAGKTFYTLLKRLDGDYAVHEATYNENFDAIIGDGGHGFIYDGTEKLTYPDGTFVEFSKDNDDYLDAEVHQNGKVFNERFYFEKAKAIEEYHTLTRTVKALPKNIYENPDAHRAAKIKELSVKGSEKQENGNVILGDQIEMHMKLDGLSSSGNTIRFAMFNTGLDYHAQNINILHSQMDAEYKFTCTVDANNQKKYGCTIQTKDILSPEWKTIEGIGVMDATQIPTIVNIAAVGVFSCVDSSESADCHRAIVPAQLDVLEVNNSTTVNDGMVYDLNTSKDFSVSAWAKPSSVEDNVLISFPSLNHTEFHWALRPSDSHIIAASAGTNNGVLVGGATVANSWKMYTITKQGNETKFYENGVFVKSITGLMYDLNYVWFAFGKHGGSQYNYKGLVDDIIVENIAVSAETITTLYNRTLHTN